MDYGFAHAGVIVTPNQTTGVDVGSNDDRNRAIEQAELARWAGRPDSAVGYYHFTDPVPANGMPGRIGYSPKLATVSTWLGTTLGTIVSARVYRHNFGGRFVSITVRGTNGARYSGRASWDGGNVIRLRRVTG